MQICISQNSGILQGSIDLLSNICVQFMLTLLLHVSVYTYPGYTYDYTTKHTC